MTRDAALDQTLVEFATLSAADRRAIERRLSGRERTLLERLAKQYEADAGGGASGALNCSPWLAKRLARLMNEDQGASRLMPATRKALLALLDR